MAQNLQQGKCAGESFAGELMTAVYTVLTFAVCQHERGMAVIRNFVIKRRGIGAIGNRKEEKTGEPSMDTGTKNAIDARDGTLLVSAAAGSGKTAVLVQRVIERLTDPVHPSDADRLLVVTFTKAAAAEMKDRIAARISGIVGARPYKS